MRALTPLEARVLGVLVEKQKTVPDTYPLSLNALAAGCNQKTARDPVISASEAEVLFALDSLKELSLVFEGSGSRVVRFEHNMPRVMGLPGAAVALLAVLMLRGPQTSAELRLNCERLHKFADISSVEGFLEELAEKEPPKVLKLPRGAGEREARWAHLLCGEVAVPPPRAGFAAAADPGVSAGELSALRAEQTRLSAELASLRGLVERIAGSSASIRQPEPGATMRFVLPEQKKLTYEMVIPIRWGDMDAMGHVNNTLYFRYLEIVRVEWLLKMGAAPDPAGEGPVIVNAFCNFLRQLEYPGDVLARHYVANPRQSSFETYITLERTDVPGVVYAEGGAKTVWVNFPQRKSAPLPDWVRRLVE